MVKGARGGSVGGSVGALWGAATLDRHKGLYFALYGLEARAPTNIAARG